MKYTKPEVICAGSAVSQIQGTSKSGQFAETGQLHRDTIAAYDADE
jgi:hypothetical protein